MSGVSLIGIVVAIVGLGFLILAHEFGHFIVAKATGMRVEEFSIGFGRFLVSKRIGETVYGISVLPLGGYVRVTGMHEEEFYARVADAEEQEAEDIARGKAARTQRRPMDPEDRLAGRRALSAAEIASTPLARRYYAHPFWHKFLFIVAGVTMNLVVAFLLVWGVAGVRGEYVSSTTIDQVQSGTPAAAAGIESGDKVLSIGGVATPTWENVRTEILTDGGKTVTIVVQRQGARASLTANIQKRSDGTGYLGVVPTAEHRGLGFFSSFGYAGKRTGSMVVLIFKGIGMMFSGKVPVTGSQGLAGPIGIIQLSSEAYSGGYYLELLALISINLAILNMIPLLPLDGGHALFSIVERIRGRSLSLRVFERISLIGLGIFVLLFIVATSNDIGRLFSGG